MHWSLALILLTIPASVNAGRILFIPAHGAESHAKSMYLAGEILKRAGHEVALLQLIIDPMHETSSKAGITDLILRSTPAKTPDIFEDIDEQSSSLTWNEGQSQISIMSLAWTYTTHVCAAVLSNETSKTELNRIFNQTWDVIFLDQLTACGYDAIQKLSPEKNTVIVDFTLVIPPSFEPRGLVVPVGASLLGPYDFGKFLYRLGATIHTLHYLLTMKRLDYRFPSMGEGHGLDEVTTKVLSEKRTISVTSFPTGLDVTQAQSLDTGEFDTECRVDPAIPEPLKRFIDDPASQGTILFAMGHYADWNLAPPGAVDSFLESFARLPQYRVIWQFAAKSKPSNVTSNVLLQSWIPQMAILNHPKTKLFISHMGMKSMREAICARVPVIAFPMFADQYRNAIIAQSRGYAVYLDKTKLSTEHVYATLRRVLDDPSYSQSAWRLQDQLTDRIGNISSQFTFQIEFFMRRNDKRILNKYIIPKWKHLPVLRQWQGDVTVSVGALLVLLCSLIL